MRKYRFNNFLKFMKRGREGKSETKLGNDENKLKMKLKIKIYSIFYYYYGQGERLYTSLKFKKYSFFIICFNFYFCLFLQ